MFAHSSRGALAVLGALVLTMSSALPHAAGTTARQRPHSWGEITRIDGGYRYRASAHDSRLQLTRVDDRLVFHDRGERNWISLPRGCHRVTVDVGIAASCHIRSTATAADPLQLEIWPRLGDDHVDASALGAEFQMEVLGDAGNDVVLTGGGDDYVNGAWGADQVDGGAGADFLRTGDGNDTADGGAGNDHVVGLAGDDHLAGSDGDDVLEGGDGNDTLLGGPGSDILKCGDGYDVSDANIPDDDGQSHCEHTLP